VNTINQQLNIDAYIAAICQNAFMHVQTSLITIMTEVAMPITVVIVHSHLD